MEANDSVPSPSGKSLTLIGSDFLVVPAGNVIVCDFIRLVLLPETFHDNSGVSSSGWLSSAWNLANLFALAFISLQLKRYSDGCRNSNTINRNKIKKIQKRKYLSESTSEVGDILKEALEDAEEGDRFRLGP